MKGIRKLIGDPRRGKQGLSFASICLVIAFPLITRSQISTEYQVKAVFLFNFTQFVEWPARAFEAEQTPLVIGILGDDPFGSFLDETVQGEKVNGHPLLIKRFQKVEDAEFCHILFVKGVKQDQLKQLLAALKGRSVLTVGDANDFAKLGGMIRFFEENKKIRIRINLEATKSAELTISSKLLRLADIVGENKN